MNDTTTVVPGGASDDPETQEHLRHLPESDWALWRWSGLRGPGFPAALVLKLATPGCTADADRVLEAEDAISAAQTAAIAAVNTLLAELPREETQQRAPLNKALKSLKKGGQPEPTGNASVDDALATLAAARASSQAAWETFHGAFSTALNEVSHAIQSIGQDERFREAIIWQNRHALHNNVDPLVRRASTSSRDADQRRREQLVATYLQRYCVKNDIIGFFGPVGWAKLVCEGEPIVVEPGPDLIQSRSVDLESWCIETLAQRLAENPALKPWIAPRRAPFFRIEGTTLHVPGREPQPLPAAAVAIIQACDGERTARQIAQQLRAAYPGVVSSDEEIYGHLAQLASQRLLSWTFEIPVEPQAASLLRRQLERIEDPEVAAPMLAALDEIEQALAGIADAAGKPEQLDQAIAELERRFTRLTGTDSTRAAGQTYAGRTLVYEDCRRDVMAALGPDLLETLGRPLSLLLTSARWFTYQTATIYRQAFTTLYEKLVAHTGSPVVDAVIFWQQAESLLMNEQTRPFEALLPQFQQRWSEILALPEGQRQVSYTSAELRPKIEAAFAAPRAGWRTARYHGPDLLLDAPDVAAIRRGDYQFVLGEIHLAANPLMTSYFRGQHWTPDELMGFFQRDLPEPHLVPVPPKHWPVLTTRTPLVLALPKDYLLMAFPESCSAADAQPIAISELVIEQTEAGLVVRTRDGRVSFDSIEAFGGLLAVLVLNSFKILPSSRYTPRVTIDRMVYQRETWGFEAEEFAFAFAKDESRRFIAARQWAHAQGLPRWVFVKAPIEIKPFYVDFDSPIYIDILSKMIRRTKESDSADKMITVSEMLPDHNAMWLPDSQDRRYACEFRFVAVDMLDQGW